MRKDKNAVFAKKNLPLRRDLNRPFVAAVEQQFGLDDYRESLNELLELKQLGIVEEYAAAFQSLQFQVCMYNTGYDDVFFVSQFIKGLKEELQGPILMQFPDQVPKAVILARIQQRTLERQKYKATKVMPHGRSGGQLSKTDPKPTSPL
jgi:hypothetical protein